MTKEQAKKRIKIRLNWAEKAEQKSKELQKELDKFLEHHDFTEPIKLGHHSQRKHENLFSKRDNLFRKIIELDKKAKHHKSKAENLKIFINTNKGDAEKKRQKERDENDKKINVGTKIYCSFYRCDVIIKKINKKTYLIELDDEFKGEILIDKSFI